MAVSPSNQPLVTDLVVHHVAGRNLFLYDRAAAADYTLALTRAGLARLLASGPLPPDGLPVATVAARTTGRHRLSRSGDRAANSALYIVAIVRMRHHAPTRVYLQRRTAEGRSKREIIRCLIG